jgi:hypothetical protein
MRARHRVLGRLAWHGAKRARRRRFAAVLAWQSASWYLRRRRIAVWLAFTAAVAVGGAIAARRSRRRLPPLPGDEERRQLRAGLP